MNIDKNLIKYLSSSRKSFALSVSAGVLAASAIIVQALILSNLLNDIFLGKKVVEQEKYLLVVFVVLSIVKTFMLWMEEHYAAKTVESVKRKLRETITSKLSRISPVSLKGERTGELTNTLLNGVDSLEKYFGQYLPQLFLSALIPLIILIFVFPIDLLSGIVFTLTAPLIPLFMYLIGSAAEQVNRKQWKSLSRMSAFFWETFKSLTTIKLFNRTAITLKKIEAVSDEFRKNTMKVLRVAFLSAMVLEVLSTLSIAIIAVEIGLRLLNGNMEFVDAFFILVIAPEFYNPVRQLGARYHAGLEGVTAYERISKFLESGEIHSGELPVSKEDFNDGIVFRNVSFQYPSRKDKALSDIDIVIEPNKINTIVGKTGSGKTTLMDLMLKFIEPQEGEILIGNKSLKNISTSEWMNEIAWVPQHPHMFYKSVYENIAMAKPSATRDEIISACKRANIHERILALPNGYNTIPGEDAGELSGGEIQRISLARAFLKDAPLLLIDEPTGNLDPVTEELILNALYELMKDKTVILIAHRKKTIMLSDKLIVLENGKVKDAGKTSDVIGSGEDDMENILLYD